MIKSLGKLLVTSAVVILSCASCGENEPQSLDPLLICGENIAGGYAVPLVIDATSGSREIKAQVDSEIFLRIANKCQRGVHFAIKPPTAATVTNQAMASDGLPVAVELQIHRLDFDIVIDRADSTQSLFHVVRSDS